MNINTRLRSCLTKLRLSSHKYLVERGRWLKPKLPYIDRKCTLCNIPDIQDEYHVTLCCVYYKELRKKYMKPYYYKRPSMNKSVCWSQTATDGAWSSTTAFLSSRDRSQCLCVLRRSGSEPKTRHTGV